MRKVSEKDVRGSRPEGTEGVDFKPLIAENVAAPNFFLRVFDVAPAGHTPKHRHSWEHETYVVAGSGRVELEGGYEKIEKGDALLIEPNELHQFVNNGQSPLKLICVIPKPRKGG